MLSKVGRVLSFPWPLSLGKADTGVVREDTKDCNYPFNRSEECSWQPEEAARNLSGLLFDEVKSAAANPYPSGNSFHSHHCHYEDQHLLSRGWSSKHVRVLRVLFGHNAVNGKDDDDDDGFYIYGFPVMKHAIRRLKKSLPCFLPILAAFSNQLKEPLILILLVSAAISLAMGHTSDAVSIIIALTIVGLVAAVQEYRSEAALEKLADLVPHTCTVVRDGRVLDRHPAKNLVMGDLIMLGTGDRVPADCRLVDTVALYVDESSLTGENTPVSKTKEALSIFNVCGGTRLPLTEQRNMAFMGTLVVSGRGSALVLAVGLRSEFGKVARELDVVESRKSPLQNKIDELGKLLASISSIAIVSIAILGWCLGRAFLDTVTVAVSLAVAAIPEGLPICVTVTLALGVVRMARSNAIVKKLPAVEALGSATVVASDKTGTLTQNEMTARSVYTLAYPTLHFGLSGVGYDSSKGDLVRGAVESCGATDIYGKGCSSFMNGGVEKVLRTSMEFGAIQTLFGVACICNNAAITSSTCDERNVLPTSFSNGQPTELALLVGGLKCGLSDPRPLYHRLQEIPFSSDRKRMEVKARPVGGSHFCTAFKLAACRNMHSTKSDDNCHAPDESLYFVKGMPEIVLGECTSYLAVDGSAIKMTDSGRWRALSQSRKMAASGLRVLAMGYGPTLDDLTFAGLIGMEDPPREGVINAIKQLRRIGVTVIMVTGDSKETALAIAKRCGIVDINQQYESSPIPQNHAPFSHNLIDDLEENSGLAMSGEQLDAIPPTMLSNSFVHVKVFYRVEPHHKLALVHAYQKLGEVVAMTGDGVNDALALKAADIGIAMGKEGTDVAKEAADVILMDDDFSTIVKAVSEGKGIFFNIRNFLTFQLSTSFAILTIEAFATAFGMPSPLNAMQILWINIIMDGPPAQSLGVEPVDQKILNARPRKPSDPIVSKVLMLRAVTSAILIVFLTLRVFAHELEDGKVTRRDTTMTFMTFVNCDLFNAYACRSSERCFYELDPFGNPAFLWAVGGSAIGQLAVIYFPPLQEVFQTEALSFGDFIYILLLSCTVLILDTMRKRFCKEYFRDITPSPPISLKKLGISQADSISLDLEHECKRT